MRVSAGRGVSVPRATVVELVVKSTNGQTTRIIINRSDRRYEAKLGLIDSLTRQRIFRRRPYARGRAKDGVAFR